MIQEVLLYHAVITKFFLLTLFVNLLVPALFRRERAREIKMTRITFFFYSALLVMVAFTGIVAFMLLNISWNGEMSMMVSAFLLLSTIEIARSRKLTRVWVAGESAVSASWPFVAAEIAITFGMIFYAAMERKDAVPL